MASGGMISSFMKIDTGVQAILRFCLRNMGGCNIGIIDGGIVMFTTEMASAGIINIPRYMKVSTGFKVILRSFIRNLRGCRAGITDGRNVLITPFRWAQLPSHTYQLS
jgi:hypothetical protein